MMTLGNATVSACGAYVLLMDLCERIEIVGEVRARKAEVNEIEIAVVPHDLSKFLAHVKREFTVILDNDMETVFLNRGAVITVIKLKRENWGSLNAFNEKKAA